MSLFSAVVLALLIAPAAYDLEIGRANVCLQFSVDLIGRVYSGSQAPGCERGTGPYTGMFFFKKVPMSDYEGANCTLIYRAERIQHKYPHCWRDIRYCFFAKKSWRIRTAVVQDKLLSNNQRINWVPEYIKTGSV